VFSGFSFSVFRFPFLFVSSGPISGPDSVFQRLSPVTIADDFQSQNEMYFTGKVFLEPDRNANMLQDNSPCAQREEIATNLMKDEVSST